MNVNHKCHFHPNHPITKFCPNKQCTLPLCCQCESIHLQQHAAKYQTVQLIRFNEAYMTASTEIQQFLSGERRMLSEWERSLQQDRQDVMKYIDNYYVNANKILEQAKGKCHQVQDKLTKLKKGSIKTLIFYFSGDIDMQPQNNDFQPLYHKISSPQHPTKTHAITQTHLSARNTSLPRSSSKQLPEQTNVFNNIEQIKIDKAKDKNRKSIFQSQKQKPREHLSPTRKQHKYNYNVNPAVENQEEKDVLIKDKSQEKRSIGDKIHREELKKNIPKFDYEALRNNYEEPKIDKQERQGTQFEPQPPVSFEHRYTSKFSASEQYQAYKKQRQEKLMKQMNYYQSRKEGKENQENKYLKASDLNLDQQNAKLNNQATTISSQRMRSYSHNNLVNHQTKVESGAFDLKKQVLAPQEIRKMLEKRIEERNRILSIKKNENFGGDPQRKGWQTRDSIINQIYQQNK